MRSLSLPTATEADTLLGAGRKPTSVKKTSKAAVVVVSFMLVAGCFVLATSDRSVQSNDMKLVGSTGLYIPLLGSSKKGDSKSSKTEAKPPVTGIKPTNKIKLFYQLWQDGFCKQLKWLVAEKGFEFHITAIGSELEDAELMFDITNFTESLCPPLSGHFALEFEEQPHSNMGTQFGTLRSLGSTYYYKNTTTGTEVCMMPLDTTLIAELDPKGKIQVLREIVHNAEEYDMATEDCTARGFLNATVTTTDTDSKGKSKTTRRLSSSSKKDSSKKYDKKSKEKKSTKKEKKANPMVRETEVKDASPPLPPPSNIQVAKSLVANLTSGRCEGMVDYLAPSFSYSVSLQGDRIFDAAEFVDQCLEDHIEEPFAFYPLTTAEVGQVVILAGRALKLQTTVLGAACPNFFPASIVFTFEKEDPTGNTTTAADGGAAVVSLSMLVEEPFLTRYKECNMGKPTAAPTMQPSQAPTTQAPSTASPTTQAPSDAPTMEPTQEPTISTLAPTSSPSLGATAEGTDESANAETWTLSPTAWSPPTKGKKKHKRKTPAKDYTPSGEYPETDDYDIGGAPNESISPSEESPASSGDMTEGPEELTDDEALDAMEPLPEPSPKAKGMRKHKGKKTAAHVAETAGDDTAEGTPGATNAPSSDNTTSLDTAAEVTEEATDDEAPGDIESPPESSSTAKGKRKHKGKKMTAHATDAADEEAEGKTSGATNAPSLESSGSFDAAAESLDEATDDELPGATESPPEPATTTKGIRKHKGKKTKTLATDAADETPATNAPSSESPVSLDSAPADGTDETSDDKAPDVSESGPEPSSTAKGKRKYKGKKKMTQVPDVAGEDTVASTPGATSAPSSESSTSFDTAAEGTDEATDDEAPDTTASPLEPSSTSKGKRKYKGKKKRTPATDAADEDTADVAPGATNAPPSESTAPFDSAAEGTDEATEDDATESPLEPSSNAKAKRKHKGKKMTHATDAAVETPAATNAPSSDFSASLDTTPEGTDEATDDEVPAYDAPESPSEPSSALKEKHKHKEIKSQPTDVAGEKTGEGTPDLTDSPPAESSAKLDTADSEEGPDGTTEDEAPDATEPVEELSSIAKSGGKHNHKNATEQWDRELSPHSDPTSSPPIIISLSALVLLSFHIILRKKRDIVERGVVDAAGEQQPLLV